MSGRFLKPLAVAAVTSALGVVINVATDLKHDPKAWLAVAALTVASGVLSAVFDGSALGGRLMTRQRGRSTRRMSKVQGIVLQIEVEVRPDGSHVHRTYVYSEPVAIQMVAMEKPEDRPTRRS
ncbi:hypothetical protein [Nonomuraea sp. NPDC049400]|uniref:hypothetical protein n=1 Tax=Nonomuraea sp. NPDC049400 TaxID=3364352 RepID=UPI00378BF5F7